MNIIEINVSNLSVSKLNVRKDLNEEENETDINDLAENIKINGLINPLTVRLIPTEDAQHPQYEVIAGQRRLLAIQKINLKSIPCNVLDITEQKAKEISLIENLHRNQLKTSDKVKAYTELYKMYNEDIYKVISIINVSKVTFLKYLKIYELPKDIILLLDGEKNNRISLDTAVKLTSLSEDINKKEVVECIKDLPSKQAIEIIEEVKKDNNLINLKSIKDNIILSNNNIYSTPSKPYVIDNTNNKIIVIPVNLWDTVIELINKNSIK